MIPEFPKRSRLYDNLQPEENDLIVEALEGNQGCLSYRTKAIGKLAYFTGMRRSDIANLRFDNISLDKEEISFIQQKTGLSVCIPLTPVVGNAIYDYIVNERPQCDSDYIFISAHNPFIKISPQSVSVTAHLIFKECNIRQEKGRREGLHLFRHAFASDLIAKDVTNNVVSELMGHASLKSLNPYLDADIEHLRECALSVAQFSENNAVHLKPFFSFAQEDMNHFVEHCMMQGIWSCDYNRMLGSIDEYLVLTYPNATQFSQEMINQWCKSLSEESHTAYSKRTNAARKFLLYLTSTTPSIIVMPELDVLNRKKHFPIVKIPFISFGAELFYQFVSFRKASGRWNSSYEKHLRSFDRHCATIYPKAKELSQEMVDTWCKKHQNENLHSCGKRIAVIKSFLKYAYKRELLDLKCKCIPTHGLEKVTIKEPHVFTEEELINFFHSCDEVKAVRYRLVDSLMALVIPVFFRLLYSSGMRTNEVRNLNIEDVGLKQGIINIHQTKGYTEHRIALHPTMKKLLQEYDAAVKKLMPNRKYFFANYNNKPYSSSWMVDHFESLWFKYNHSEATAYNLRHNYATTNINSWPAQSELFNRNLLYLSRSMGHATIDTTMYYYHFTPIFAEILKERKAETFNEIISNHTKKSKS